MLGAGCVGGWAQVLWLFKFKSSTARLCATDWCLCQGLIVQELHSRELQAMRPWVLGSGMPLQGTQTKRSGMLHPMWAVCLVGALGVPGGMPECTPFQRTGRPCLLTWLLSSVVRTVAHETRVLAS